MGAKCKTTADIYMPYYKQMIGEKCYLSPINTEDAEQYCKWLNDLNITMHLEPTMSLTPETEAITIRQLRKNNKVFGIVDLIADSLIGAAGLHEIDYVNGTAMFGIFIGNREFQRKGYGLDATKLTLDYGFNVLNLLNICLKVYEYNPRAIELYERCGFKYAGRLRNAKKFGGRKFDIILMDILAEEFESVYIKNLLELNGKNTKSSDKA